MWPPDAYHTGPVLPCAGCTSPTMTWMSPVRSVLISRVCVYPAHITRQRSQSNVRCMRNIVIERSPQK